MRKLVIVGFGGLGREVLGIIQSINRQRETWNFLGFYDDNLTKQKVNGFPVMGKIEELNDITEEINVVIAIGNARVKNIIRNKINNQNIIFPNIFHPSVQIYSEDTVVLGKGIVIAANAVLTVNINIKDFVYINASTVISHDTIIGESSMIMPTVSISGGGNIGARVYIGNGTKIDYFINIPDDTVINAGTILSK
jgi:sugar O-acyltransferase (sialic acid O-acetyltransferase NeuD family)